MTRGITNKARDKDEQAEMKSMKLQLSIGVNCMVARITAFVALYMVAGSVTTNETTKILVGLGGAVIMMIVEMTLHIVRDTKLEAKAKRKTQ